MVNGMHEELAIQAASVMTASLPQVTAEAVKVPGTTSRFVIVAVLQRGKARSTVVIKNPTELGLMLAALEIKSGRDLSLDISTEYAMA
jgi:hypothetical protein